MVAFKFPVDIGIITAEKNDRREWTQKAEAQKHWALEFESSSHCLLDMLELRILLILSCYIWKMSKSGYN